VHTKVAVKARFNSRRFRPKRIVVAIGLGALIAAAGCGDSSEKAPRGRTLTWKVSSVQGPYQVRLVGQVDYCAGAALPKVEKVHSRYSGENIYLRLVLNRSRSAFFRDPCRGSVRAVYKSIKLRRNVASSVLYDSGVDPAAKRWPGE